MFNAILYTQWKWSRLLVLAAAVAGFALPILSVQGMAVLHPMGAEATSSASSILELAESRSIWFAALSAAVGLLLATVIWRPDHMGCHQYTLSLPISRSRFVLLRFSAGALLLAVPITCFAFGALLASASLALPPGLQTYPFALSIRFALAALVAYSIFFAISAATAKTASYTLAAVGGLASAHVLLRVAGVDVDLLGVLLERASYWPGPGEIFTGRWTLIDV